MFELIMICIAVAATTAPVIIPELKTLIEKKKAQVKKKNTMTNNKPTKTPSNLPTSANGAKNVQISEKRNYVFSSAYDALTHLRTLQLGTKIIFSPHYKEMEAKLQLLSEAERALQLEAQVCRATISDINTAIDTVRDLEKAKISALSNSRPAIIIGAGEPIPVNDNQEIMGFLDRSFNEKNHARIDLVNKINAYYQEVEKLETWRSKRLRGEILDSMCFPRIKINPVTVEFTLS